MKYLYIGKKKDNNKTKYIYCDERTMRFYAMDESFTNEDDGLEYLYDLMDEDYEDEHMQPFRIKNPDMIKALTLAYKARKLMGIRQKQEEAYKRINERDKIQKVKSSRRHMAVWLCFLLLATNQIVYAAASYYFNNKTKAAIEESLTEDKQFENYDAFGWALTDNETLSDDLREVLFSDFNRLIFSDTPILENDRDKIIKRIEKYDFTNLNRSNYLDALEYILFGKENTIKKCVASSLDRCANGDLDPSVSEMFGELTVALDKNMLDVIFVSGTSYFKEALANVYDVEKSDIDYVFSLLESYINSTDEEEKANYYTLYQDKVASFLSSYYMNKEELTEFDKIILASQIFGGDYYIDNNVFDDYIKVTHSSDDYESYTKYFDQTTKEDISMYVYQKKLTKLIEEKGTYLDYDDPDCRFLLYLYTLCYKDDLAYYNKDLFSVKSSQELTNIIISSVFDEEGFTTVKKEFIYNYFTCGKVNGDDIIRCVNSLYDDAFSVSLYVDVVNCLKKEDYIKEGYYSSYVERELRGLERDNLELYNEAVSALENGDSLFDKLSFLPSYQAYKSDEVKKYILEQKSRDE